MANINNLQMWDEICTDARLSVSKSMFGLKTTVVYTPTGSKVNAYTFGYSPSDGAYLKRILESMHDNRDKDWGGFHPKPVPNGNFLAEVCTSEDDAYLAVMLFRFVHLNYLPETGMFIFEGAEARAIKQLLF